MFALTISLAIVCMTKHVDIDMLMISVQMQSVLFLTVKRHPKICKFMRDFGRCKFTSYCKYNHRKVSNIFDNAEKIAAIEQEVEEMRKKSNPVNSLLEKKNNEKFADMEKKMETVTKQLEEKVSLLKNYEIKVKSMEDTFGKKLKDIEDMFKQEQQKIKTLEEYFRNLILNVSN